MRRLMILALLPLLLAAGTAKRRQILAPAVICTGGAATTPLQDTFDRANESWPSLDWCESSGSWGITSNQAVEATGASNRTAVYATPLSCAAAEWGCIHIGTIPDTACVGIVLRGVSPTAALYAGLACEAGNYWILSMPTPGGSADFLQGNSVSGSLDGLWLCYQVYGTGTGTAHALRLNACNSVATCLDYDTWSAAGAQMGTDGTQIDPQTGSDTGTFAGIFNGEEAGGGLITSWVAGCEP